MSAQNQTQVSNSTQAWGVQVYSNTAPAHLSLVSPATAQPVNHTPYPQFVQNGLTGYWIAGQVHGWSHIPVSVLDEIANRQRPQGRDPEGKVTEIQRKISQFFASPEDGRPWYWTGSHWTTDADHVAQRKAAEFLDAVNALGVEKQNQLLEQLSLRAPKLGNARAGINVGNGFLTIDQEQWQLSPHDPSLCQRYVLPFDYDTQATCPRWTDFLEQMQPDPENRQHLQQMFGWTLLGAYRPHIERFFVWLGSGANGKSVALSVLQSLVGVANCSYLSMHEFTGHNVEMLGAKLVNLGSEVQRHTQMDSSLFKRAVTGEPISATPKYRTHYTFVNPAALVFAVNDLPCIDDRSDGIWRRMMILEWPVQIAENQRDVTLAVQLANELPGILNWALEGALQVVLNQKLASSKSIRDTTERMRTLANTAAQFLSECADTSEGNLISKADAYASYVLWCKEGGYSTMNKNNFGKEVHRILGHATRKTPAGYTDIHGNQVSRSDAYLFAIPEGHITRKVEINFVPTMAAPAVGFFANNKGDKQ